MVIFSSFLFIVFFLKESIFFTINLKLFLNFYENERERERERERRKRKGKTGEHYTQTRTSEA